MKLSSIKINGRAVEEGAWVDTIPQLPGVRLRVRGLGNLDYRRLRARLLREIPQEKRIFGVDPVDEDEIEARLLGETVLTAWEGIENDAGEPMEFSQAQALGLLRDPDYAVFRGAVVYAGNIVTSTKAEDAKADAGN